MGRGMVWIGAITMGLSALGAALSAPGAHAAGESVEISAVQYGTDGGPLYMDVHLPASGRRGVQSPVVVLLHGGGWAGGGRADVAPEADALARAGLAVLNVDYRLSAPGAPGYPHQISDVQMALDWARGHAAALGLDTSRVGALGVSAGGNLALELGVRGVVSEVVAWSAPTDLGAFEARGSRCTTAACGPLSMPYAVYRYLGCMPEACAAQYAAASPADRPSARGVAYQIWNSAQELIPASQEDEFVARQRAAGVVVTAERVAGHRHAAQYADVALAPSVDFLARALGVSSS
jgi:acetyl esterase